MDALYALGCLPASGLQEGRELVSLFVVLSPSERGRAQCLSQAVVKVSAGDAVITRLHWGWIYFQTHSLGILQDSVLCRLLD